MDVGPRRDGLDPRIVLASLLLLRSEELRLVGRRRPMPVARLEPDHGFREQLLAHLGEPFVVDRRAADWPEAAPACRVFDVGVLIGRADEHALARLDHVVAAERRSISLLAPGDESLEGFDLSL